MTSKLTIKKPKYAENERVLCYQGPILYEAKCLKFKLKEDEKFHYFIHYNGWNKHWDEWVPEQRILKYIDVNLAKQKDLLKQFAKDKSSKGKLKSRNESSEKRKAPETIPIQPDSMPAIEAKKPKIELDITPEKLDNEGIEMPKNLQLILADDWDLVHRQKQLFRLPAAVSTNEILQKYFENRSTGILEKDKMLKETIIGLEEYFNVLLGSHLLYRFERPHFGDVFDKYPSKQISQLYGLPHFLRFFIKIKKIISIQNLPNQTISQSNRQIRCIRDVLDFISKNTSWAFNINDYETAPAEYHRRALT